ncbi:hypothetical protein FisN_26Hu147 [Fistulifera solaris]|uniref:Uncharacterized protein n=1 Tax=Fistulifera solaris TaxID=1519565 RepID=A0A1Z5JXT7_FISSO|nr:hypothetical protein FisN_26Hu147 [Fistulifera solaris]|eukprot:GAX18845.1 hypothetical protein FisN_26Hu147 [Fistulifera solaris]
MPPGTDDYADEEWYDSELSLTVQLGGKGIDFEIFGSSDVAICETAAYFLNLVEAVGKSCTIGPDRGGDHLDFSAAGSECLARLLTVHIDTCLHYRRIDPRCDGKSQFALFGSEYLEEGF